MKRIRRQIPVCSSHCFSIIFSMLFFAACQGGGSSGTGLTDTSVTAGTSQAMMQICGVVNNTESAPLAHWTITVLATGGQAETDDFGRFVLPLFTDSQTELELTLSNNQNTTEIRFLLPDLTSENLIIPLQGIGQISIINCQ